jgi:cephalosporin-C deacetylase-like acetyl esterase
MSESIVTFRSEGVDIEALWFVPDGPGPYPTIVMAGGWCYVKELVQPQYAAVFRDAGFAALIFDYRGFGGSGGEPRQHLDPWRQIEDYRNAVSHLETRPEVDSGRIAAWGISYSGGHALIVGAVDRRVRTVLSVVPVVEGLETMRRAHGTMGFRRFTSELLASRRRRFLSGEHEYMKHSSEHPADELCTWPFPGSPPLFQMLKETQAPRYENRNTVASAEMLLDYSVAPYVARLVDTPTLMVLADNDDFTQWDLEMAAFNAIPSPRKHAAVIPETGHHDLYRDPAKLATAAAICRDFLVDHLGRRAP